ncbi:MAG: hypothetical protein H8E32_11495 [Nitrospinae bacterium]|nr:hypothetical protein [Nitrospinota bacterium]
MKKFIIVGGVLGVVGVMLAFLLFSSLDSIITEAVEHFGSEITQTEVSLDKTVISATTGKGALHGLKVTNPKPFKTPSAFEFSEVSLELDIGSVTKDTVIIKEIVIAGPEITYEMGANGSNIDAIKKNVDSYSTPSKPDPYEKKEAESSEKSQKKLIIEKLIVRDGKINVSASFLNGKSMSVSLPGLTLNDIGKDKGGASPGEITNKIITALRQNINKAVGTLDLGQAKEVIEGVAKDLKGKLEKGIGDPEKLLDGKAEDIGNAVKGLF